MSEKNDLSNMTNLSLDVSNRKDHRFLVELYRQIEEQFDVNSLCLQGVNIWPLIRLQLGRSFKEADQITDAGMGSDAKQPCSKINVNPQNFVSPKNKAERSALIKYHSKKAKENIAKSRHRVERDFERLDSLQGPKFVVLTKIEKYFLEKEDGFYAPILDPVAEDLAQLGRVQILTLEPLPIKCINEPVRIDLQAYLAAGSWEKVEIPIEIDKKLKSIENFTQQKWPEYPLNRKLIYSRFNRLRQRRDYFYEVYRRLKPEFIVVSSFTGWLHALWAAKDLDIPVIDIQHGGQGPIHISTTHFTKHPDEGYHFLPDVLWLWGKTNYDFAAKWHPAYGQHRHLPVVGGHRGVARWERDRATGKLSKVDHQFIEKFSGKANVLVTLSYAIDPLMPDAFFKAIQQTDDLHWLIRLHPIHRSDSARDQIVARLTGLGCSNFSIDEPTEVQMQTALFVSKVHLTPFSTSVREATAFGVPSAICHPAGKLLFLEEIETGLYEYVDDVKSIIEFVKRRMGYNTMKFGVSSEAIEVSDEVLKDVLLTAIEVKEKALPLHSFVPKPRNLSSVEHNSFQYLSFSRLLIRVISFLKKKAKGL